MRKLTIMALCLLLAGCMTLTCFAAGTLSVTDAAAEPGKTVYLTVMLNDSVVGNTLGISYSYDSEVLTAVTGSNSWGQEGILQDFSKQDSGVWAVSDPVDLKGPICVLAFQVAEDASFTKTEVTCTVIVKNGSTEVATYTAVGAVTMACEHSFSGWTDKGAAGHSHSCTKCGLTQTESHHWDSGKVTQKEDEPNVSVTTYTCGLCGATKQTEVENIPTVPDTEPTRPEQKDPTTAPTYPTKPEEKETRPETTQPTVPTTKPTQPHEDTTVPPTTDTAQKETTAPSGPKDYNDPEDEAQDADPHDHDQQIDGDTFLKIGEDVLIASPNANAGGSNEELQVGHGSGSVEAAADGHDHDHTTGEISGGAVIGVVSVLVLAVAAAVLYLKKKH